jgi:hypothetical protein
VRLDAGGTWGTPASGLEAAGRGSMWWPRHRAAPHGPPVSSTAGSIDAVRRAIPPTALESGLVRRVEPRQLVPTWRDAPERVPRTTGGGTGGCGARAERHRGWEDLATRLLSRDAREVVELRLGGGCHEASGRWMGSVDDRHELHATVAGRPACLSIGVPSNHQDGRTPARREYRTKPITRPRDNSETRCSRRLSLGQRQRQRR